MTAVRSWSAPRPDERHSLAPSLIAWSFGLDGNEPRLLQPDGSNAGARGMTRSCGSVVWERARRTFLGDGSEDAGGANAGEEGTPNVEGSTR